MGKAPATKQGVGLQELTMADDPGLLLTVREHRSLRVVALLYLGCALLSVVREGSSPRLLHEEGRRGGPTPLL